VGEAVDVPEEVYRRCQPEGAQDCGSVRLTGHPSLREVSRSPLAGSRQEARIDQASIENV